jgi:hypothetical protein
VEATEDDQDTAEAIDSDLGAPPPMAAGAHGLGTGAPATHNQDGETIRCCPAARPDPHLLSLGCEPLRPS